MPNQQLINYVNQGRKAGISDDQIRQALLDTGWQVTDIDQVLGTVTDKARSQIDRAPAASTSFIPRKKLWPKIAVGIILALLIGAGSIFAYKHFVISPSNAVVNALANVKKFKTAEYQLMMEVETIIGEDTIKANRKAVEDLTKENPALGATLKKSLEESQKNLKGVFTSDIKINLENPNDPRTDTVNKSELAITTLNSITRTIMAGGGNYITLLEGEEYSPLTFYASKNQWVMLNGNQGGSVFLDLSTQASGEAAILRREFLSGKFFKTVTKDGNETIDGTSTNHFAIMLDDVALKNAFGDLIDALLSTATGNNNSPVAQATRQISFSKLDLWISKNGQIPRKATITITNGDSRILTNKITYTYTLKNFNQPITIEVPTNWITLEEASGHAKK